MKNGIHKMLYRNAKGKLASIPTQVKNGFRDRNTALYTLMSIGMFGAFVFGVISLFLGETESGMAGIATAKILPLGFKVNKEGVDKDSDEFKFLDGLEKRVKIEGGATHDEITAAIKAAVDEGLTEVKSLSPEKINKLLDEKTGAMAILLKQGEEITRLKGSMSSAEKQTYKSVITKAVNEFVNDPAKMAKLKEAAQGNGIVTLFGSDKIEKAVGNITTGNVATDTGGNAILDLINADEIATFNLRQPFIEQFATVTRTAKPVFVYADYEPKEGDAGFTAEAAAKSQMDLNVVVKSLAPKKATGYEIMSEEAVDDIPRLQSEATTLLFQKYLLKRQSGILAGDGTNNTPVGVISQAGAWDNATWDTTNNGVVSGNLYDALIALANQIYTVHNYTDEAAYFPNVAFVNPKDFAGLKLKKNEFGMYLFPQLILSENSKIDNFALVPQRDITAGKVLIGDFTKLRIINYIDYYVKMGWINDQFIKNLFTMLGEGRFYTLIKNLDKKAFVYADIATVLNDIKTQ